jgi:hypothetical protein
MSRLARRARQNLEDQNSRDLEAYERRRRQRFYDSASDIQDIVSGVPGTMMTGPIGTSKNDYVASGINYIVSSANDEYSKRRNKNKRDRCGRRR